MSETSKARRVMISSTARDLPEHRKEVMDACLRQGMFPELMEHLPAADADAIQVSVELVDKADIYLGVFAHRYGYVPEGHEISITEMEYQRAVKRSIPRLIFLMDKSHPISIDDVEMGEGAAKLKALKARLEKERVVNYFKSPADLRAHVINTLSQYRKSDLTAFHYVSDIPVAPEPYVAHPYTLLQVHDLIGRAEDLDVLTRWISDPTSEAYPARVFNIVALGGEGKSALAWKWFNEVAPRVLTSCAGFMWWSFYESDAYFENFVVRALAYVTGQPLEEIQHLPLPEREKRLLRVLDDETYVIVLDGLERILIAYNDAEAARLPDDDLDEKTANLTVAEAASPETVALSFVGKHRLRKTIDPRAGAFLRRLAKGRFSRILISSRLYPAELQTNTEQPVAGSFAYPLRGLNDDDAVSLWHTSGVAGSREKLIPLFHTFGNHALLIHVLASEVAHYRHAPGDFDRWRLDHPDFNPFRLPIKQARSHVLGFALQGIDKTAGKVLHTIAAFRTPVTYDTLTALLVGRENLLSTLLGGKGKPFADEASLIAVLGELEDRGLLAWDKRANRYDLHPIVRGVVWAGLDSSAKQGIYQELYAHFESIPPIDTERVKSFDDLTATLELYNTLIGLRRYEEAGRLFHDRLNQATLYQPSISRQRAELLELLFPDGLDEPPRLSDPEFQAFILNNLGAAYGVSGYVNKAAPLFIRQINILNAAGRRQGLEAAWFNLASALRQSGELRDAEAAARWALLLPRRENTIIFNYGLSELREDSYTQEAVSLHVLGLVLAARGEIDLASTAFNRALRIFNSLSNLQGKGSIISDTAQLELWLGNPFASKLLATRSWNLALAEPYECDLIRARRLQGSAALGVDEIDEADKHFHAALARARAANLIEEELPTVVGLAELQRRKGNLKAAQSQIEDVWELAERGPYPAFLSDALNVLAKIELDRGRRRAAEKAAAQAYKKAWCEGPPFAYHWGLEKARGLLRELEVEEPLMPAFDESKFEPMPEVEIDPADEFGEKGGGEGRGEG